MALGVRRYGKGTGLPMRSAPVRFFFRDPAYAGAFGAGDVPPGAAVEGAVAGRLARAGPGPQGRVTYWGGGGGGGGGPGAAGRQGAGRPVSAWRTAAAAAAAACRTDSWARRGAERGAVISKNEMGQRAGCSVVPAAVFLALA